MNMSSVPINGTTHDKKNDPKSKKDKDEGPDIVEISEAVFFELFGLKRWTRQAPNQTCQVDWVEGSCFLIKREVIKQIGLLDEKFFMYIEEVEFCYRAQKAGFKTWYYPETKVFHLVRGSSPEGKQKAVNWIHEDLIYFYQKHFASWQLAVLKCLLRFKKAYAQAIKLVR